MNRIRTCTIAAIGVSATLYASPVFAHNGKAHIEGTVTAMGTKQMLVKKADGRSVSIRTNKETTYRIIGSAASATHADVSVGSSVVVESFGMPGGEQTALEVQFSQSPKMDLHDEAGKPPGEEP